MRTDNYHLVIIAGGSGTRFWPLSRQAFPKQFHDLFGQGTTLLQATAARFQAAMPLQKVWVVTQHQYVEEVKKQLPFLEEKQILSEPVIKNTAPCIAYACYKIASEDPQAKIISTPADHLIRDMTAFKASLHQALTAALYTNQLIILGVPCIRPTTGYGYIAFERQEGTLKNVIQFIEKPTREEAERYLLKGNYAWNTGIFIGSTVELIKHYQQHLPELWKIFEEGKHLLGTSQEPAFIKKVYYQLPFLSFEKVILEKAKDLRVALGDDLGWLDIGTWNALSDCMEKDEQENIIDGNVLALATQNCIIKNTGDMLVAVYGLKDLIVVQHDGAVMICPKEEEQNVKQLVAQLKTTQQKYL